MQQLIDFILEIDKLKAITRKTRPLGLTRYENPAEHSWQIALFAILLAGHSEHEIDINRVVRMLLVHDIGEIDAGDVMVYAEGGWKERKAAELAAVKRIFGLLPEKDCADYLALWQEFDNAETPEARFAHAVDRAMPVLLNLENGGQSWKENSITYERVVKRIGPPIRIGCPALWNYLEKRLEQAQQADLFGH